MVEQAYDKEMTAKINAIQKKFKALQTRQKEMKEPRPLSMDLISKFCFTRHATDREEETQAQQMAAADNAESIDDGQSEASTMTSLSRKPT